MRASDTLARSLPSSSAADEAGARSLVPSEEADIVARTLGGTEIWVHGTRIQRWGTKRGLMILRYLLWHGRPAPRETLMDLLWPNSSPQSARNNLNVPIYGLRRTLESGGAGPFVVHRDGTYQIAPRRTVWIDAHAFVSACAQADRAFGERHDDVAQRQLRDAIALYHGPLFADDTTGEWYLPDRRALAERYAGVLHRLALLRHEAGDVGESIELCRRALRVEPCREVTAC
jgi:two-component SAPR family response regulator